MANLVVLEGLTDKQKKLATLLADGVALVRAGEMAGYADRVSAWVAATSPNVERAVFALQRNQLRTLGSLAIRALKEILELPEKDLPTYRLKREAAQTALPLAGHVAPAAGKADNASDKSPAEMTNEELQERLRLADQAKAVLADRAHPVLEGEADSAPSGEAGKAQAVDMLD